MRMMRIKTNTEKNKINNKIKNNKAKIKIK